MHCLVLSPSPLAWGHYSQDQGLIKRWAMPLYWWKVAKQMVGRRLSQAEAKKLLAKLDVADLLEMSAGSCVYLGAVYKEEWFDGSVLFFFYLQQLNIKKRSWL
jgi:hypothetical protein